MAVRLKDRIEANIRQSDKVNSSLSINGKTFNGSTTVDVGVIGAAYGGTGQTTLVNSANALINALGVGTATPGDQDYYISGGTTTTTYHRRPHSALYTYIKNKASGTWGISISGNANTATKLATARTIQINLASTSSASFNGTDNITPGVTGILAVGNGGTGANNRKTAITNLGVFGLYSREDIGTSPNFDNPGVNGLFELRSKNETTSETGTKPFDGFAPFISLRYSNTMFQLAGTNNSGFYIRGKQSGDPTLTGVAWEKLLTSNNWSDYAAPKSHSHNYAGSNSAGGAANSANWLNINSTLIYGASGLNYFNISGSADGAANTNGTPTADWYHIIRMNHANGNGYYFDIASCFHNNNMYFKRVASGFSSGWQHIWVQGNSITGAVWNDYAEYRESDCKEFGKVVSENGDDTLSKTTKRLQHFAGVTSDTWGFCQGETEKAKTPIAVAGRVLVYTYQDRNNYKPGDCVCAAPNGTVDIMTRQEVIQYPDRIVGTVSCIPDYEEWGQGDRPAVKVDGRIWIKVR